jgi:hypothetical protein
MRIENLLHHWHQSPDLLFSVHPVKQSLISGQRDKNMLLIVKHCSQKGFVYNVNILLILKGRHIGV